MTYRKETKIGVTTYARLNENGRIRVCSKEIIRGKERGFAGYSDIESDWSELYNNWQHINAREFNDAYNLVKENI